MTDVINSRGRALRGRGRGRGGLRGRGAFRGRGRGRGGGAVGVGNVVDAGNGNHREPLPDQFSLPTSGKDVGGYCGPPLPGSTPPINAPPKNTPTKDGPPSYGRGSVRGGRGGRGGAALPSQQLHGMNGSYQSLVGGGGNGYQGSNQQNGHSGIPYRGGHARGRPRGTNTRGGFRGRDMRGRGRGSNRGGRFPSRGRPGFRGSDCYVPGKEEFQRNRGVLNLDVQTWLLQNREGCEGVKIGPPNEIAFYSRNEDGDIDLGSRASLYPYRDPPDGCPLTHNFQHFFDRGYEVLTVDPVLQVLPPNAEVHFLSLRTCLENISSTPYNFKFPWSFVATREDDGGAIVFHHNNARTESTSEESTRNNYYAHSFKAFATGMLDLNDASKVVNTRVEFRSVVTRLLGPLRLAFAAQVDAQDIPEDQDSLNAGVLENYVKLRTVREPETDQDKKTFYGVKLRKLWFQAFLAGTGNVVVGMRDEDGAITRLVRVKTEDLPEIANGQLEELGSHIWKPSVMLGFMQRVLMLIRQIFNQHNVRAFNVKYEPVAREIRFSYADERSFPKKWSVK